MMRDRLALFGFLVSLVCACGAAYGAYVAAESLIPLVWPDLGVRDLGKLNVMAAIVGFGGFFIFAAWVSDLIRRARGMPRRFSINDPEIRRAIFIGKLWVNWPIAIVFFGIFFSSLYGISRAWGNRLDVQVGFPLLLAVIAASAVPAWLWWSFMLPRWLVWAMRRVSDLESLFFYARVAHLLYPANTRLGRFFARNQRWTPELRRAAQDIMAAHAKAGAPGQPAV